MLSVSEIKSICLKYGLAPSKSRGQNFLIDQNIVEKILAVAEVKKDDIILEVGPGLGVLTGELVKRAKTVYAVELDKNAAAFLRAEFSQPARNASHSVAGRQKNLEIIEADILRFNLQSLPLSDFGYKIVSNLPYNITSHFLKIFLGLADRRPKEMVIMIQQEVGERLMAVAGEMNLLAIMAQFYAQPEILFKVSKNSFWPVPKIDSVVLRFRPKKPLLPPAEAKDFFRLVKIGFAAKRKQLHNNLAAGLGQTHEEIKAALKKLGFDERVRAQDLAINDWVKLYKFLS